MIYMVAGTIMLYCNTSRMVPHVVKQIKVIATVEYIIYVLNIVQYIGDVTFICLISSGIICETIFVGQYIACVCYRYNIYMYMYVQGYE